MSMISNAKDIARNLKEDIETHLAHIEELERVCPEYCADLKSRANEELARIAKEEELQNLVMESLSIGKMEKSVDENGQATVNTSNASTSELERTTSDLQAFNPRAPDGKETLALGYAVIELRKALLGKDWTKAEASVIKVNASKFRALPDVSSELEVRFLISSNRRFCC